jgi:FtsZ-interacting cell division protein ZipA
MSWKSRREKEKFFEDLDKAFNTPSTEKLVVPRVESDDATEEAAETRKHYLGKRTASDEGPRERKRRTTVATDTRPTTGVGQLVRAEKPKPRRPNVMKSQSLAKTPTVSTVSEKEQPKKPGLFDGIVCFFIPNSKLNGVRRYRMTLFAKHGADVRHEWSEDITHILCDNNINGERILETLRWEQFPVCHYKTS